MRTKKPPKPVIVTDPVELAFLRIVRSVSLEEQADFAEAVRLMAQHRPAQEQRAGWLRFFQNAGYLDPQERAAGMMRLLDSPHALH